MDLSSIISQQKEYKEPYIIAEAGVNHEGSMDLAKRLIDEAKEGGAHAIKFQTYKADTIASKHSPYYWDISKEPTRSQHELFQKYDKFWKNEFEELKKYCDQVEIDFLSTPFDVESAKFLNDLMPVFKVSSSDLTNRPFIEFMCNFGKPILLSTGASYLHEIHESVKWIADKGNPLSLMHCVLNYPTPNELANLASISLLKEQFPNLIIGYSDHTLPEDMKSLEIAFLLGAKILEKHFTHDKTLPGNDHYHAMDKEDLKKYNELIQRVVGLLGSGDITNLANQEPARENARRSLVANKTIQAGEILSAEHLTWKRPAHGVSPRHYHEIIGKKARIKIDEDTLIQWDMVVSQDQ